MKTFGFTLQLDRTPAPAGWWDGFVQPVFPFAPDPSPLRRDGTAYLGFDRDAASLSEAVASAIRSVHQADAAVSVCGVTLDDGQPIDSAIAGVDAA